MKGIRVTMVTNPIELLAEYRRLMAADNDPEMVVVREEVTAFNSMSIDDRLELLLHMTSAAIGAAQDALDVLEDVEEQALDDEAAAAIMDIPERLQ